MSEKGLGQALTGCLIDRVLTQPGPGCFLQGRPVFQVELDSAQQIVRAARNGHFFHQLFRINFPFLGSPSIKERGGQIVQALLVVRVKGVEAFQVTDRFLRRGGAQALTQFQERLGIVGPFLDNTPEDFGAFFIQYLADFFRLVLSLTHQGDRHIPFLIQLADAIGFLVADQWQFVGREGACVLPGVLCRRSGQAMVCEGDMDDVIRSIFRHVAAGASVGLCLALGTRG